MPAHIPTQLGVQLITAAEAAEILHVTPRTIHGWISEGTIPYVELPRGGGSKRSYRIPLQGLLNSLSGNYDLAGEVEALLAQEPAETSNANG